MTAFEALSGRLLVQCRSGQARVAAAVAGAHGAGLVLTGPKAVDDLHAVRASGFGGPILCDAARYAGGKRVTAARNGIRPAWSRRQESLGAVPLTDSGYIGERDREGLRSVLKATDAQRTPAIALLPLSAHWLRDPEMTAVLGREVARHGVPVAVAIEHAADPFGVQAIIRGFLQLLRVPVPVLLLRSDVSVLGALCHGAYAGAVGAASSLRHVYPQKSGGRPASVSAFVPHLLSYRTLDNLSDAILRTPDLATYWTCDCPECDGRRLDALTEDADANTRHSLHGLLDLHADLLHPRSSRQDLITAWHERCSHALNLHEDIEDALPRWKRPQFLHAWYQVTKDLVPERRQIPTQVPGQGSTRQRPASLGTPPPTGR